MFGDDFKVLHFFNIFLNIAFYNLIFFLQLKIPPLGLVAYEHLGSRPRRHKN